MRLPGHRETMREKNGVYRQLIRAWGGLSVGQDKWVVFSVCLLLDGCGGKSLEEISGKITYQGKPVTVGIVTFSRPSTGSIAQGTLGEGGVFTLAQNERGLLPGEYKVTVTPVSIREVTGDSKYSGEKIVQKGGESIPMRCRKRNTTRLRVTVPSDSYDFDLVPVTKS